ncbi:hypothetical protein KCV03_g2198, partial [Aureobasidium melanogenum]
MIGPSIPTQHGFITEQEALEIDLDVIPRLHRRREADGFRQKLQSSTSHIRELISRHLRIAESDFVLDGPSAWIEGGFNICLGIEISNDRHPHLPKAAVICFPLPFNIGEDFAPGAMDEKLRCEAATYIWLRENCPNIPLPRLLGMGFPGTQTFTAIENETVSNWLRWYFCRAWNWLHGDKTSPYSVHTRTELTDDTTYTSAEYFIHDTLSYQDHRMTHQMNAILDEDDGVHQLSALVGIRALLPHFWNLESRKGPFVLSLPDLHASNIFVDDDWNIVGIIDLEFAPVVPIQMVQVPHWLTDKGVDELHGPELDIYKRHYDEFENILEQEEETLARDHSYSQRLRREWETGRMWYVMALGSINAFPGIFEQHLQPRFFEKDFETHIQGKPLSRLWCEDVDSFIAKKLRDYETYKDNVRNIFAAARREQHISGQEVTETM